MRELLREWVLSAAGAALLSALALTLTPEGRVRRVVRLLSGVVLALALVRPLAEFDFESYAASLAVGRAAAETAAGGWEETGRQLERSLIEAECAAYISDRAAELGLRPGAVSVTAKWGDALCWYPYEATLQAAADGPARLALAQRIEAELGIPAGRLHWEDLP